MGILDFLTVKDPAKPPTPRKQQSGTSYSSTPVKGIAPPSLESEIGSQRPSALVDVIPELATRGQALQTYKRMVRSEASIRSALRAAKASILGAEFYIDSYSELPEDQVIGEFVSFNVFTSGHLPWTKNLEAICRFIENGYSVMEVVWELREWAPRITSPTANLRDYTVVKKLAERPARTIQEFQYDDNGGVNGLTQAAINSKNNIKIVKIPIDKLIIFTFEGDGNIDGESALRSCHRSWVYKDKLYTIDAIQKERHGIGVPDIEIQPGASKKDKDLAHELGRNLRVNEMSYIVRTPALHVGFAELQGQPVNALDSAIHHDNQIMKNLLVQFINMGIEGGGGRSTGSTAFDMYMKAMRYVANMICDYFNLYLIPKVVAYNFPTDKFPKMCVRNIGESKDFQMWSAGIRNLMEANGITPDMPTEQFLRQIADMPAKTEPRPEYADTSQTREQILLQGQVGGGPAPTPGTPAPVTPKSPTDSTPGKSRSPNGGAGNLPKGNSPG